MENAGVGWIAAIIIGGFAGWLAEKFMKSDMGIFMNILLGMIGAAIASAILELVGRRPGRVDRLSDRRLHWRVHPDLGRPRAEGSPRLDLAPGRSPGRSPSGWLALANVKTGRRRRQGVTRP